MNTYGKRAKYKGMDKRTKLEKQLRDENALLRAGLEDITSLMENSKGIVGFEDENGGELFIAWGQMMPDHEHSALLTNFIKAVEEA